MRARRILGSFWRTYLFIFVFLIVVYLIITFRDWQADWTIFFLRTQNWGMIVFLSLLGFLIVGILAKLLQWEFHVQSHPPKPKRRFKR